MDFSTSPVVLNFPQSNGQAERCVQTVKNLLKKSSDPNLALLSYRTTPLLWYDLSPAELCMGRRLRTSLPQTNKMLTPQWEFMNKAIKVKQKENFDFRHRVREVYRPYLITQKSGLRQR